MTKFIGPYFSYPNIKRKETLPDFNLFLELMNLFSRIPPNSFVRGALYMWNQEIGEDWEDSGDNLNLPFGERTGNPLEVTDAFVNNARECDTKLIIDSYSLKNHKATIKRFREEFGHKNIIIDTQTVINGLMIDAYLLSDKIILVTDYSIESIGRILVLYNILSRDLSIPVEKIDIIINKKKIFDFLKIWDYTKIAGIPLAGFISFDKRFSKSFFLSNYKRVCGTRFYRQIKRFIENES